MGIDEVPLNVFILVCNEQWGSKQSVRLLKMMGYGPYSADEFDDHKKRLRSRGVNLERLRRLLQAKLLRSAVKAELREIALRVKQERLMLASLNLMN